MNQSFTVYTVFFIVTSVISFLVAFIAFERRKVTAAKELAWLMLSTGIGAFFVIFETVSSVPAEKIFWSTLEYIGGLSTPVIYLIFVLRFTGKDNLLKTKNIILLFLVPIITFLLVATNGKHHLVWTGFSQVSPSTNLMEYYHGPAFWIGNISYSYIVLLLAAVYLVTFIISNKKPFRTQAYVIIAGGMFPWIVSAVYISGHDPVPGFDLTPSSTALSGIVAAFAILNFRLLDLAPIARETLVEIMPDGILALDSKNRIQDINRAAIDFLDIRMKKIVGYPASMLASSRTELIKAVIDEQNDKQIESEVNGEIRTFHITSQPVKNQPGSRLVIISDITDQKRAEKEMITAKERAEESDRLKSAFLANMSHEIRTPMNGILGFTELLKMSDISSEQQHAYLDIIRKGGERMLNIINDIIDISKIESGQMRLLISTTNINEHIESISSFFMPEAEAKGIHLIYKISLPDEESVIRTDSDKFYAVLTNLVKNAIKFTRTGYIEYGYEKKDDFLEFYVRDTGIGIRPEHQKFIFERFRQGSDSLTRNYEGTGLGLSISKAYVKMLGGKICFQSEFGKGSTFSFSIPYNTPEVPVTKASDFLTEFTDINKIKPLTILLAEDDKASELLISKLASPVCQRLIVVSTGPDSVEACRNNPDIDLVLMDIKLPGIDGYEATRIIRSFNNSVVIIAQTAFGLVGEKEKAIDAGCNDYISKPIRRSVFYGLLSKHFSK
jgi:PAS domain S-box-containing protein